MRFATFILCYLLFQALQAQEPCNVALEATTPTCPGDDDGVLTVVGDPGPYTYFWDHDFGLTGAVADDLSAGIYTVMVTGATGCVSILQTVLPDPIVPPLGTITTTNISCEGEDDGSVTFTLNPGLNNPWAWAHNPNLTTATLTDQPPGIYTVVIANPPDCPSIITSALGEPGVEISGSADYCPADPPLLSAIMEWGFQPDIFAWSNGETTSSIQIEPGTEGTIELVAINSTTGCIATAEIELTELPSPYVLFAVPDSMCQFAEFEVHTVDTDADSLVWRWGNSGFSNEADPIVRFTQPYWQPISLQGFDEFGCGNLPVEDSIYIHLLKPAHFTVDQIPCSPVIEVDLTSDADSCAFFIGDSLVINECYGFHRLDLRRYQVYDFTFIATQTNMCNDTTYSTFDVRTEPTLFLPTAFTPNGDGLNDEWPGPIEISDLGFEIRVFDRWGVSLWSTNDPSLRWNGGDHPTGIYVYTMRMRDPCELTNEVATKGFVTILR